MKHLSRSRHAAPLLAALTVAATALPASATEGAMGRAITGAQIQAYAGVVPPEPGMQWSLGYLNYDGKIGASRPAPIAGQVSLGLRADVDLWTATGVYIWPTGEGRWNFASMLTAPYILPSATATLEAGGQQRRVSDSTSNWFDLYFAPVIASYHISQVEHVSYGLYVYAPTAKYDPNRLANAGMNVWTFSPSVGYTRLFDKGSVELSLLGAVDFYTRNDDTNYKNAPVWRLDSMLVKRTPGGWGFGVAGGWVQQLGDDSGPTADRLNGFKGRSFGLGPLLSYGKKWSGGQHLDLSARYVSEFNVKNRFKGSPVLLTASFSF
ncbi:MAG TPA: transporter [Stenotrophomonas sp.]|nr:transporter [Stenotrophomonas sp.]